jgi:hypothetical protein
VTASHRRMLARDLVATRRGGFRMLRALPALLLVLPLLVAGCLPDSRHALAVTLLSQLTDARSQLADAPASPDGPCEEIGGVRARLYRELGRSDAEELWVPLRHATDALMAACGQLRLLGLPATEGRAVDQAKVAWREGAERQLREACAHLRVAAGHLGRSAAGCAS